MEYFTAESYRDYERIGEPILKNNKLYTKIKMTCPRCNGSGYLPFNVDSGICFKCRGGKYLIDTVRLYTAAEIESQKKAAEKIKEKKIKEKEAAEADNKLCWLSNHGFSEDGITYLICGNTFDIKDQLKAAGAKFDALLKWHTPHKIELADDFPQVAISFDEIYTWTNYGKWADEKSDAKKVVQSKMPILDTSEFIGAVGDKLSKVEVTLVSAKGFDSFYGYNTIFTFKTLDNNVVTWITSTLKDIHEGEKLLISGTVKELKEYNSQRQTVLTRCKIEKV